MAVRHHEKPGGPGQDGPKLLPRPGQQPPPDLYVVFPPRQGDGQRFHGTASSVQNRRYPSGGCGHPPLRDSSAGCPNAGADTPGRPLLPLWGNSPSALIGPRQLSSTLTVGRPSWPPAGGDKPRPYILVRRTPRFRGPYTNPAKRFAWGKGGPAAEMSFRACPEANDPKLGPTLSRCAPSAAGSVHPGFLLAA